VTVQGVETEIRPARNALARNGTRHVFAVDLGASGGKCFVASVGEGVFALTEVHRFKHEPAVLFLPDRTGAIESRTCWDDLFIYNQIIEGLRVYRREVNQLIANACGAKVLAGPEEATAVGNAIMQAMALGMVRELSSARRLVLSAFPVHLFNPKDRAVCDAAYQRYLTTTRQKVSA